MRFAAGCGKLKTVIRLPVRREYSMKKYIVFSIIAVLLVLGLWLLLADPVISCETELPANYLEAVKSQSEGVYSSRLPLIPVYVSVESFVQEQVRYTIHYFPFGTVGMSYTDRDGYNIEKPLTGA